MKLTTYGPVLGRVDFPLDRLVLDDVPELSGDEGQKDRSNCFLSHVSSHSRPLRGRKDQLTSGLSMCCSSNGTLNSVGRGVISSFSLYGLK